MKLVELGISGVTVQSLTGELCAEAPVHLSGSRFFGKCQVGFLTYMGAGCEYTNTKIGRFCSIASKVYCGAYEHPVDWLSTHPFQYNGTSHFSHRYEYTDLVQRGGWRGRRDVTIGNDVWIGEGAFFKGGVVVGDGAIIAAKSVVTKNVPPYAIVAGVPAKVIRYRFDNDTVEKLLSLKWWEYDLSPHAKNLDFSNIEIALEVLNDLKEKSDLHQITTRTYDIVHNAGEPELTVRERALLI